MGGSERVKDITDLWYNFLLGLTKNISENQTCQITGLVKQSRNKTKRNRKSHFPVFTKLIRTPLTSHCGLLYVLMIRWVE